MRKNKVTIVLIALILILSGYILIQGGARLVESWRLGMHESLAETTEKLFLPGIYYAINETEEANWLEEQMQVFFPFNGYVDEKAEEVTEIEDSLTYDMILEMQAKDEERLSEDLDDQAQQASQTAVKNTEISMEKLRDFNYLISKFYTVDSTTMIYEEELDVDKLLAKDMHIDTSSSGPKVLIFHTHSQEMFADSVSGDPSTSIVGIGAYLAQKLNEKGIETMHHDGVYDLIDGTLDRSKAYELSEIGVREILNQYPSIEVVIDLHRDGVSEDLHLVTEVDGKQTAKIMFFNGLSRTKANGDIAYLQNPYIQDNLSFSLQMQLASESMYPGLARKIYLKGYRYSLHMMPKSLLIEAGAQTNTVQEMKNAMDLLANILENVLIE